MNYLDYAVKQAGKLASSVAALGPVAGPATFVAHNILDLEPKLGAKPTTVYAPTLPGSLRDKVGDVSNKTLLLGANSLQNANTTFPSQEEAKKEGMALGQRLYDNYTAAIAKKKRKHQRK